MNDRLKLFLSMLAVCLQVFIFFPVSVWAQNQFNFDVGLVDAVDTLVYALAVLCLVTLLLTAIVPGKLCGKFASVFIAAAVIVYIQQNLLVWDYGVLDGRSLDFDSWNTFGLLDIALWCLGLGMALYYQQWILQKCTAILILTITASTLVALVPVMTVGSQRQAGATSISEEQKFSYSREKNVILFILDAFQSDLFWQIIETEERSSELFDGFTFYPNTSAVFAKTYPTIPLLLTGKIYRKQQTIIDFIDTAYQDSLLESLVDLGWNVGLYPHIKSTVSPSDAIMSNVVAGASGKEKRDNYLQALDISLLRCVPHFLKKTIYRDGDFVAKGVFGKTFNPYRRFSEQGVKSVLSRDEGHAGLNFLANLKRRGVVELSEPAFRLYHLMMPHEPFLLNRNLEEERSQGFAGYQQYAYASYKLMASYLAELKKLGIYQRSAIIVAGDHGGGDYTSRQYSPAAGGFLENTKYGPARASGKPLLLAKGFGRSGAMDVSLKPLSLADVAPTLANFAGIGAGAEMEGRVIDEVLENESRSRSYYHYGFSGWDSKYLEDFDAYQIDGDVYDERAWTRAGVITSEEFVNEEVYLPGGVIRFASDAKRDADYMNAFIDLGNYRLTPNYLWAPAGEISVSLRLPEILSANEIYDIEVELACAAGGSDVVATVNGEERGRFSIGENNNYSFTYRPDQADDKNRLDIHLSTATGACDRFMISRLVVQSDLRQHPGRLN